MTEPALAARPAEIEPEPVPEVQVEERDDETRPETDQGRGEDQLEVEGPVDLDELPKLIHGARRSGLPGRPAPRRLSSYASGSPVSSSVFSPLSM